MSKKVKLRDTDEFFQKTVKEIKKNHIKQDEGFFGDYCVKIKKAFDNQIKHVKFDKRVDLFENYNNADNLRYHYEQFVIKDWDKATNKQIEKTVKSILEGLKEKLNRDNAVATIYFKDQIDIRGMVFKEEFMDCVENDNLCFYLTFDDIKTKVKDMETDFEVEVGKKYQFTLWFIYEV